MSQKVIAAAEALVGALKEHFAGGGSGTASAATRRSGRTTAVRTYTGGNPDQDMMDVARRAIRYARTGKVLSKKERNLARKVLKEFKSHRSVLNTNGVDVWTHAGL